MNLRGELVILFGALAAYFFWIIPRYADRPVLMNRLKLVACLCILIHLIPMGIPKWYSVDTWPGHLPPMSLISGVVVIISIVFYKRGMSKLKLDSK